MKTRVEIFQWIVSIRFKVETYDADELRKSQAKLDFDFHAHVLNGADEFVVAAEEIAYQPFFIFRTRSCVSMNTRDVTKIKNQ